MGEFIEIAAGFTVVVLVLGWLFALSPALGIAALIVLILMQRS